MRHNFGIVIFVPLSTRAIETQSTGGTGWIKLPPTFDPEDPFCYNCGQKVINAESDCQGKGKNTLNVDITALRA